MDSISRPPCKITVALPTELNEARQEQVVVVIRGKVNYKGTMSGIIAFAIVQL